MAVRALRSERSARSQRPLWSWATAEPATADPATATAVAKNIRVLLITSSFRGVNVIVNNFIEAQREIHRNDGYASQGEPNSQRADSETVAPARICLRRFTNTRSSAGEQF